MQEVFEKIIEKIKSDSSVKLYGSKNSGNYMIPVDVAIEIVKHAAAEYNNDDGWILCSERLPEEYDDVEVTIEEIADDVGGKRYYNVRSWLQDGQWVIKKNPYHPTVIAWKYPTEPYQPKGE